MNTAVSEATVLDALRGVRDPDLNRDIVTLKFIKNLRIDGGHVAFTIELTTPACPLKDQIESEVRHRPPGRWDPCFWPCTASLDPPDPCPLRIILDRGARPSGYFGARPQALHSNN